MKAERFPTQATAPDANGVSVIMVSYHTGAVLWRAIESVLKQENLHELIIVDNGNPQLIQKRLYELAETHPNVIHIKGQGNVGFATACNLGVKRASGKYVLLLNPDCVLSPDTFSRMIQQFEAYPGTWAASCRLVNADHSDQHTNKRNLLTPTSAFVESFQLHRFLPKLFAKHRLNNFETGSNQPAFVPAVSGAFILMERERYASMGGMDEEYFLHVEDLDFCLQIKEHGGKILFVPNVEVVHFHRTSEVSSFFVEHHKTKGFVRYFKKNFSDEYASGVLPLLYALIYLRFGLKSFVSLLKRAHPKRLLSKNDDTSKRRIALLKTYEQPEFKTELALEAPVLLTGTTGQVGLCVLRRLLAANIETISLYHDTVLDFTHNSLHWLQGDLRHHTIDLETYAPKTVIHTAAIWLLPRHIEHFANAGVKRIIAFSSTSVIGKKYSKNPEEQKIVKRLEKAEQAVAALCQKFGIEYTILRPTMVYGVGLDGNITRMARFIKRFEFFPIFGVGRGKRAPVHADDLAIAALTVAGNAATFGKTYNLGGKEILYYLDMVERIFICLSTSPNIVKINALPKLLDWYGKWVPGSHVSGEMARRMDKDLVFEMDDAKQDFGYNPREFLENERDVGV